MKGLFIMFGESFRSGGQYSRIRGNDESYFGQIDASLSQMRFIKNLNVDIDVYISSYSTKFDNNLLGIYSKNRL